MKMNGLETIFLNSPVRAFLQRRYEAPLMERLGGRTEGGHVLEVGCGRGVGTQILFEQFGAARVQAFDLDAAMVERARRRLARYPSERLKLDVGDVTAIKADDQQFDAVFDFNVIHHVPSWQSAIGEVSRVIKPGGRFFFVDMDSQFLDRWVVRTFTDHPKDNRFSSSDFVAELDGKGFVVEKGLVKRMFGDVFYGVATMNA